jgi:uncharacterized protein
VSVPERTCAGCGRKRPQDELVRFAAQDGRLVADRARSGRGVYTCRRLACFERAASRRAFSRVLRQNVSVDPELAEAVTDPRLRVSTLES